MRTLLGVLHAEDEPADYAPQPSLRDIEALVERARAAGLPVELTVEGARRELPAGIDLAAYRVVQEALTNVVKHGGGAETQVRVRYHADAVEVTVADQGGGTMTTRLDGIGPRPRGHARARPRLRRRAPRGPRATAAGSRCARCCRCSPRTRRRSSQGRGRDQRRPAPDPHRRRPGARPRRLQDDPRRRGRPRRRRRGGRRRRRGRARAAAEARRRADGHPHAGARRHRGHAARGRRSTATRPCAC